MTWAKYAAAELKRLNAHAAAKAEADKCRAELKRLETLCKGRQNVVQADGSCWRCGVDQGVECPVNA